MVGAGAAGLAGEVAVGGLGAELMPLVSGTVGAAAGELPGLLATGVVGAGAAVLVRGMVGAGLALAGGTGGLTAVKSGFLPTTSGLCEVDAAGFWSAALRVTRTVSFISGTADVVLERPILEVSLERGILDVPFLVGMSELDSLMEPEVGALSLFSLSLMREGEWLRATIKRTERQAVKLPKP